VTLFGVMDAIARIPSGQYVTNAAIKRLNDDKGLLCKVLWSLVKVVREHRLVFKSSGTSG